MVRLWGNTIPAEEFDRTVTDAAKLHKEGESAREEVRHNRRGKDKGSYGLGLQPVGEPALGVNSEIYDKYHYLTKRLKG